MRESFKIQDPVEDFSLDQDTWIIADTHFFHTNIGHYCNRPDGWQNLIIGNWNHFMFPVRGRRTN